MGNARRKHGMTRTRVYGIWLAMHKRCTDKNSANYPRYGARGIRVCERWDEFENFLADMGEPPEGYQIDRIDNDGPYSPENCRWATREQNAANKSTNVRLTYRGETHILAEWARRLNLNDRLVRQRLHRGWTVEQALSLGKTRG